MEKVGRNDPCPCGSGKKFKKCCENKMIGKRFMATKIDTSSLPGKVNKAFNVSSIFKAPIEKPQEEAPKEVSAPAEEKVKVALEEKPEPKVKRTYTHKEKKKTE